MKRIKKIFDQHHGNYGYRRMTCVLRNEGMTVNHKKVKRLMIVCKVIRKRNRYSFYRGAIEKLQEMKSIVTLVLISHKKIYTDVTEFRLNNGEKVYLSPILDGFNGEIIAYDISRSPPNV